MSSKGKKLLEDIHPLHIIREVQKWPVLYVKNSPERANLNFKNKIWTEIAKALFGDWDKFSAEEKECKVSDLQRKWRNLRDTFKRQIEIERKIREGHSIKKKTYVYFKYMLFLLPHLQVSEEEEKEQTVSPILDDFLSRKRSTHPLESATRRRVCRRGDNESVTVVASRSSLDTRHTNTIDEDEHFLMSLIPSFKKMTDDEKLTAKMDILKVIKQVRSRSERRERAPPINVLALDEMQPNFKEEVIHLETDHLSQSFDESKGDESEENSD